MTYYEWAAGSRSRIESDYIDFEETVEVVVLETEPESAPPTTQRKQG